jgi:hypothetical protein
MNRTVYALALALSAAACAHQRSAPAAQASAEVAPAPAAATPSADAHGMCPMSIPGTKVSAGTTPDAATLTFTTTAPDQVPALREKVAAMAAAHDGHAGAMEGHGAMHGSAGAAQGAGGSADAGSVHGDVHGSTGAGGMHGDMHGAMGGDAAAGEVGSMPPPATVAVEEVDGGARLVLTPRDPADLERLQSTVRAHAYRMQKQGGCGMMQHPRAG